MAKEAISVHPPSHSYIQQKLLLKMPFFKIYKERVLCENSSVQVLSLNYSNSKTIRVGISFSICLEHLISHNFSKFCEGFFNQNFCLSFWPGSDFLTALSSRIQIFCF